MPSRGQDAGDLGDAAAGGARRPITFSRSGPVALVGPLGPGLASANRRIRPDRSKVAIWCTLAVEYPNWSATRAAARLVDEVGAHRLVPALGGAGGLGEEAPLPPAFSLPQLI